MSGKIPVPDNPVLRRTGTRLKRRTSYVGNAIYFYLFVGCWLFLLFQDTVYSYYIPGGSKLRLTVPLIFFAILGFGKKIRTSPSYIKYLGIFFIVGFVSSIAGASSPLGFMKLLLYMTIVIPLASSRSILVNMYPNQEGLKNFANILLVIIFFELAHYFVLGGWLFSNPNQAGMLTVILLPLLLYSYHTAQSARVRNAFLAAIASCLVVALLSKSRASIGADIAVLMIFYSLKKTKNILGAIAVLGVIVMGGLLFATLSETVSQGAQNIVFKDKGELFDDARTLMFDESIAAIKEKPLLGYGFGLSWKVGDDALDFVLRTGRLSWLIGEFGNSTLAMLVGGGILLTLAFYFLVFAVLLRSLRIARRLKISSKEYLYIVMLISAVGGLLIHAQAEGWLLSPLSWVTVMFWLYLSLLAAFSRKIHQYYRSESDRNGIARRS